MVFVAVLLIKHIILLQRNAIINVIQLVLRVLMVFVDVLLIKNIILLQKNVIIIVT